MSTELYRKYIDIINENSQTKIQLDEGIMDKLNPYIQKLAKALMSKFDPNTLQSLKQAHAQAGGDKNKFMQLIGISQQDLSPLIKSKPGISEEAIQELYMGTGKELKSKVLSVLMNTLPAVGIVDFLTGGNIGNMISGAEYGIIPVLWYLVSFALMWGIGNYDMNIDKATNAEK